MHAFWIILTGALVAVSCGLLGAFLILRKMSMIGDAISHAVLPGIVVAFLFTGSLSSLPMLIGAALTGVLTTLIIEFFHKQGKVQADASIGVTFTALFALGVVMVSALAGNVDLDQDCVLYGELAFVPLNRWITASGLDMGPQAVWVMSGVLLLILVFIGLGYKELLVTTFDAPYAAAVGISTALWHYTLMGLVSLTTVAAFESVGAILVVALLIAPPATAYLLTHSLRVMLALPVGMGVMVAVLGYYVAVLLDGAIAGAMASVAGGLFALAVLFSPQGGVLLPKSKPSES